MAKTMSPSEKSITRGQIAKLQDLLGNALLKSGLPSEPSQQVIEHQGNEVVAGMLAVFRNRVEAISNMLIRHITVNRIRTPMEAINATGRNKYLGTDVVAAMPRGKGKEVDVYFIKRDRYMSDDDWDKELVSYGLKPVDPYSLAAINEADPAFADEHPNGTHWKDANGNWCYAAFNRGGGKRNVDVHRHGDDWGDYWWFAGLRK